MWSWAWKRIAVSSSSALSIARHAQRSDDDALVGDAQAHVARELSCVNRPLRASANSSGSCTSPSRKTPASSGSMP